MSVNRTATPELFDSFHESASQSPPSLRRAPPPLPEAARREPPPSVRGDDETVAVAMSSGLAVPIRDALQRAGLVVGGMDTLRTARVVVIESDGRAAAGAVINARQATHPSAAILLVLTGERGSKETADAIGAASRAGAFACVHTPIVAEELQAIVAAAVDVVAAKTKVATLSKKLDLDAHLASIGRISAGLTHEIANPLGIAATNLDAIAAESERVFEVLEGIVQAPFAELPTHLREARTELAHGRGPDGIVTAIRDSKQALRRIAALLGTMRDLVGGVGSAQREKIDLLVVANEVAKRWLVHEHGGVRVTVVGGHIEAPADAVLVQQILQNITANAIHAVQAQPDGHVRLHVYQAESYAVVSVRDNGPGIAPELHDRVFEPFFTTRRGVGGTGLGLALCREYAARMGADLSLWSVVGRGTCFRLTIPLG